MEGSWKCFSKKKKKWNKLTDFYLCPQKQNYFACVRMLNGNNPWSVEEDDVIRLQRNDAGSVWWMFQRIGFRMEISNRQQLNTMKACLQNRIEKCSWSNKCQKFDVAGSADKKQPRKTWSLVIRRYLEEWKSAGSRELVAKTEMIGSHWKKPV